MVFVQLLNMPRNICCICRTGTSKPWHQPFSYQQYFEGCFGVDISVNPDESANSATSQTRRMLCSSCQADVRRYKNMGKTRFDKPNSGAGKIGKPGHKRIGGVRVKSPPELFVEPPPKPGTCSIATNTEIVHQDISKLQRDSAELSDLTTIQPDKMLSSTHEKIYTTITKHKLNQSQNTNDPDVIYLRNSRGPPLKLQKVTDTRVNSKDASKRTVRNRAVSQEKFEKRISSTSNCSTQSIEENITTQRVVQMNRDREGYAKALKKAKFVVHANFSRHTVLKMRSMMPMTLFKKNKAFVQD